MTVKYSKVVRKYWEYLITKVKIIHAQRVFVHQNVRVKYMLKKGKTSKVLVVVFSSCTRMGLKARYNYVKTLGNVNCHQLFILDDYAADKRGSYYLGHNFLFDEEMATNKLIDEIIRDLKPDKVVFCGSSKGGYSALNFGLQRENSIIVSGGPQYYLASYLKASGNLCAYEHIMGEPNEEKDIYLNHYLQNRVVNDQFSDTQKIYLHYSNKEHTYEEHIIHLIDELNRKQISCEHDIASYTNHSDISYYFPDFLKKIVTEINCC